MLKLVPFCWQTCNILSNTMQSSVQAFLSLDSLDAFLADRLFSVVSQGQDRVSFDQLVIAKANCLKVLLHASK